MREWLERFIYTSISVIIPLAVITANAILNFGGILLTIGLTVWMGFSLIIFSPFIV
ncbi:MAG: hypothetical protein LN412_01585 [Candidatus Thermoplasmatota archaeon]|nr:hypothetical protein [Candidatus Thermoplasmatota archaeon]